MVTRTATTTAQLNAALNAAIAGDRIVLNGSNYGAVEVKNLGFAGTVTIASATPGRAVVSNLSPAERHQREVRGAPLRLRDGRRAGRAPSRSR